MELSLRRWKPSQLLLGWGAYWAGLVGVTLGPAIRASWRAAGLPDNHGTISAGFGDGMLNYSVIENGVKTWTGAAPLSTVMLWVIGPPLLLWLVWLVIRERPARRQAAVTRGAANELPAGTGPAEEWRANQDDRAPVARERIHTPNP